MISNGVHHCRLDIPKGVTIFVGRDRLDQRVSPWRLQIARLATQEDLEVSNWLENIGDSIWITTVVISHCPYCGEKLEGIDDQERFAERCFQHDDYVGSKSEFD